MARKTTRKSIKKKQNQSFVRVAVKWLFVAGLWAGIVLAGIFTWYAKDLPDITKQATFERKISIVVKAVDGSVIGRYGETQGNTLTIDDLPPHLVHAVLAIEDRRFYHHFGIDPIGLLRATFTNLKKQRFAQGGSTITQQLAKNLFLSRDRNLKRKIQEAMLALWLEYRLTKDEILSAYLNRVYFGGGTYGVDAASKLYFNKPVQEINLREAATLAGLLKAPSRYSPIHNPNLSRQRADLVLQAMEDSGYISKAEATKMGAAPPPPSKKPGVPENNERYFADWIVDGLDDLMGTPTEDIVVETTLNPKIQGAAEQALTNALQTSGKERAITQGAVVVMRPNGEVVAMVGGADYSKNEFNRAVQAKRQPGSSFKPVVYLAALQAGWTPDSLIVDEPITTGRYRPKNFGNQYYGEVRLSDALMLSLNTVAFNLAKSVGVPAIIDVAKRLGIYSDLESNLSLALGSSSVSPLELTTAYAVLANGGLSVFPYAINKITSTQGKLYYQRPESRPTRRVLDARNIYDLTMMMRRVIEEGTGRGAALGYPAAGKTGTSQNSRDAWFAGFTDELVGVVWLGNDDNSPMKNVTGGSFPARIWQQTMSRGRGMYSPVSNSNFTSSSGFQTLLDRILTPSDTPMLQQDQPPSSLYDTRGFFQHMLENVPAPEEPVRDEREYIPSPSRYNE